MGKIDRFLAKTANRLITKLDQKISAKFSSQSTVQRPPSSPADPIGVGPRRNSAPATGMAPQNRPPLSPRRQSWSGPGQNEPALLHPVAGGIAFSRPEYMQQGASNPVAQESSPHHGGEPMPLPPDAGQGHHLPKPPTPHEGLPPGIPDSMIPGGRQRRPSAVQRQETPRPDARVSAQSAGPAGPPSDIPEALLAGGRHRRPTPPQHPAALRPGRPPSPMDVGPTKNVWQRPPVKATAYVAPQPQLDPTEWPEPKPLTPARQPRPAAKQSLPYPATPGQPQRPPANAQVATRPPIKYVAQPAAPVRNDRPPARLAQAEPPPARMQVPGPPPPLNRFDILGQRNGKVAEAKLPAQELERRLNTRVPGEQRLPAHYRHLYRHYNLKVTDDTLPKITSSNVIGTPKPLGSGTFNTVFKVDLQRTVNGRPVRSEGIFKPLSETEQGVSAMATGVSRNDPQIAMRNLSTQALAQGLEFDVIAGTSVAVLGAERGTMDVHLGLVMEKARGTAAYDTDPQLMEMPETRTEIAKLQFLDHLTGQTDRHSSNYFVDVQWLKPGGNAQRPEDWMPTPPGPLAKGYVDEMRRQGYQPKVKVTGIDNDQCFGDRLLDPNDAAEFKDVGTHEVYRGSRMPGAAPRVVAETIGKISHQQLDEILGDKLKPSEVDAAHQRLDRVKEHLSGLQRSGMIIENDEWDRDDVKASLGATNSYAHRDARPEAYSKELASFLQWQAAEVAKRNNNAGAQRWATMPPSVTVY